MPRSSVSSAVALAAAEVGDGFELLASEAAGEDRDADVVGAGLLEIDADVVAERIGRHLGCPGFQRAAYALLQLGAGAERI